MSQRAFPLLAIGLLGLALLAAGCGAAAGADDATDPRNIEAGCPDAEACYESGTELQSRLDEDGAVALGVAHHLRACELGHGEACMDAGLQFWGGFFVEQDLVFAQELFERSCDLGFGQGCNKAGTMVEMGWGVPGSAAKARSFYTRGCDLGDPESCADLRQLGAVEPALQELSTF
jgi:TPR repeat protein